MASVSIRLRLLLLVLAVLLPGIVCGAWMIGQTINSERQSHARQLRENARTLGMLVERELNQRATVARLLSLSPALDTALDTAPGTTLDTAPALTREQMAAFALQAQRAMLGLNGWVELSTGRQVLFHSRLPGTPPAAQVPSAPDRLVDAATFGTARSDAPAALHTTVVYPVQRNGVTRLNLAVTVPAGELQRIVDSQALPARWTATVLDSRGVVVARHPYAAADIGRQVPQALTAQLAGGGEGECESLSDSDEAWVGHFSTSPQGWNYLSAMPRPGIAANLPAAVLQVSAAALLLLGVAAAGAVWVTRSIVKPVLALKLSAEHLQAGVPIPHEPTGIVECDEVASALAEASESIRHARADLERQVGQAVQRTRAAEQRAAQSQRVEALGRLTGGMAHDFNNLLGVISNSTHLVQRQTAGQSELQMPLAAIQRAVEVGSRMTQTLLRFAGRQPVRPQQVDLGQYLPEVHELLASVLGQRIELQTSVEPGTPPVTLDVSELELALINLALNARDAMRAGGHVWLRACNAEADDLAGLPPLPGGYVLVNCSDDGRGMDPSIVERVFEPFYTTKSVGQGTGLGLSQVHGFCTQAGGTARLGSTPGLGTTVTLLLPASSNAAPAAADAVDGAATAPTTGNTANTAHAASAATAAAAAAAAAAATATASAALAGVRLLLVEDNDELATVTEALLRSYGCHVHRASNADDALQWLREDAPLDAVLSDIVMPGSLDGLGLARLLRAQRPELPLLLMSGYSKALAAARDFVVLNKPYQQDALIAALQQVLAPKN